MQEIDAGRIRAALEGIAERHGVAIPFAVESGSRAWGFPSPDSDFDCRFVYVRPLDDYLTPWPQRDVIELPLVDDLDVNGWDLAKALRLLAKGNVVIVEWLTSPIAYRCDAAFRDGFMELARAVADRGRMTRHYFHLGEEHWRRHLAGLDEVPLKKLFYTLRPAAALRWLRVNPQDPILPMNLLALLDGCDPPAALVAEVRDLVARKAVSRELGAGPMPPATGAFIADELDRAKTDAPSPGPPTDHAAIEAFFRAWVRRLSAGG